MFTAATLNLGLALVAGALIAFVCHRRSAGSTDDFAGLLVFFLSLASVFGIGGAYLACRHIQNRAPLWAIPTAIGTFAIVLPLASYPNVAPVINWIAGLAATCALISTAVAVTIRGGVYSRRNADMW
ncbi:hypothetical protein [Allorhodopirellula heiligendammensis]|uniref:Uncharacterized protein n=1 Tax=Allorhodopirellula heiligendammensis TaxID=2714739 RepID=A0A5C6AZF9_9BACT|nr:hypothetical protein [Allorhodopirellula heiligendammensis]TWU05435.1 hypothetical protein Poly21_56420 [Allorhodopirellula heiligendammensis]